MATCRAVAYYSRRDGSANIKIRILHHDQQRRVAPHLHALPGDVTPGGRIRSAALQKQCDALIHRCLEVANDLSYRIEAMPIDDLAELIRGAVQGERPEGVDIYECAERVTEGLAEHTRRGYKVALREYTERDRLDIAELRRPMLLGFVDFVRGRGDSPRVGGEWAPVVYLRKLAAPYRRAAAEYNEPERGVIRIPPSPFEGLRLPEPPPAKKRAPSRETMQRILDLPPLPSRRAQFARDMFMLSFSLAGMNAVDMYSAAAPVDGVVTYERQKTRGHRRDRAEMRIRVEPHAAELMRKYADPDGVRLFDVYRRLSRVGAFNPTLSMGLRQVAEAVGEERLTFHAARHTWATLAAMSRESGGAGGRYVYGTCGPQSLGGPHGNN